MIHVEEILLIIGEPAPCVNQALMGCPRVLSRIEQNSRQVVLGFTFGEYPAGQVVFVACARQSTSIGAGFCNGRFPVAIDYGDESWTIRLPLCAPLHLQWHLSLAANAVNSGRIVREIPQIVKGRVKLLHDAFDERAVTEPILDQDAERFVGESGSVFGREFVGGTRVSRHAHRPSVRLEGPGGTLDRFNEHFVYPLAAVTNPRCGLHLVGHFLVGRVPHVPAGLDLVQNSIQPPVGVRIVRYAWIDFDAHALLAVRPSGPSDRQNFFIVFNEHAVRPAIQFTIFVDSDLLEDGSTPWLCVNPVN